MSDRKMTALVVEADDPLDNRVKLGKDSKGTVRILIETKSDPIYVARSFKLDRDHWPVRGMKLPVTIDPADPGKFEVNWDDVPSIEERAEANDPTLVDPAGTKKRTQETLIASGATGPGTAPQGAEAGAWTGGISIPDDVRKQVVEAQAAAAKTQETGLPDHFQEDLDMAAKTKAPKGKTRAVVLIAASEATLRTEGGDGDGFGGHNVRDRHGKHDVVLAVTVPGIKPYAVFMPKFKHPRNKGIRPGGLPALVSSSDPNEVEVLWDEMASVKETAEQAAAEAMQTAADRMTAATEAMGKGFAEMPAPAPGAGGMPQLPADMQKTMAENAKKALEFATDPAMRKMLIDQYRAAGIEIDEDDESG